MSPEEILRQQKEEIPHQPDRMLRWFAYAHLPESLAVVSKPFHALAWHLVDTVVQGPERTVALRKLLEAKDAAVRAAIHPGS